MGKATIGGRHPALKKKKVKYVTRSKALSMVQIPLDMFRHLCILKGIYPKEPKKKKSGRLTYSFRDIKMLERDPLVESFHRFNAWMKKLRKSTDKEIKSKQENLIKWHKPEFNFDHLVKERYNNFRGALKDLSDCISLLFMARNFPTTFSIDSKMIDTTTRLCEEFCTFVAKKHLLTKVFVTIKGIYFEAQIEGVPIMWVSPLNLSFGDFKVKDDFEKNSKMEIFKSFILYYTTLTKFVNYRFFAYGLKEEYPPKNFTKTYPNSYVLNLARSQEDEDSKIIQQLSSTAMNEVKKLPEGVLNSLKLDENRFQKQTIPDDGDEDMELDEVFQTDSKKPGLSQEEIDAQSKSMFSNMVFFLSRELPVAHLEFSILAFGGEVSPVLNENVTSIIVEREKVPDSYRSFEMLHPQWIFDSINSKFQLPKSRYLTGPGSNIRKHLPPHLSPFVDYEMEIYTPAYATEIQKMYRKRFGIEDDKMDLVDEKEEQDEVQLEKQHVKEIELEREGVKFDEHVRNEEEIKKKKEKEQLLQHGLSEKLQKREEKFEEEMRLRKMVLPSRKKRELNILMSKRRKKQAKVKKLVKRRTEIELRKIETEMEGETEKKEITVQPSINSIPMPVPVPVEIKHQVDSKEKNLGDDGDDFNLDGTGLDENNPVRSDIVFDFQNVVEVVDENEKTGKKRKRGDEDDSEEYEKKRQKTSK